MAGLVKMRKMAVSVCLLGLTAVLLAMAVTAEMDAAVVSASAPSPSSVFISSVASTADLAILTQSLKDTMLLDPLMEALDLGATVFAPTNASFMALGSKLLECLTTEPGRSEILRPILLHHVTMGMFTAETLTSMGTWYIDAFYGSRLLITQKMEEGTVRVDNANVIAPDAVSNDVSVAHVIDSVLIPAEVIPVIRRICLI